MPLIIPSNTITGGYEVDNSLRFDEASGDYLSKASFGTPTSTRKSTISFWCKRSLIEEGIIFMNDTATFPIAKIYFDSSHRFSYIEFDPSIYIERTTNAVFRDVSAWYHIIVAIDTEQVTADDRVKVYINGVQETSFSTSTTPAQNTDLIINDNLRSAIGGSSTAGTDIFEGYISEIVRVDGQQLNPTSFGEFDEDSGIWKPIDVSGLTFGTNGFYLPFENSAALGQDDSGNGNNFTVNNLTSIDQTTDTPNNNWCTLNSLDYYNTAPSNGNLTYGSSNGKIRSTFTLPKSGKWYWEAKLNNSRLYSGLIKSQKVFSTSTTITSNAGSDYYTLERQSTINNFYNASTSSTSLGSASVSSGDVMAFAYDADTRKFWIGYGDGTGSQTWYSSGNPATGTNELTTLTDDDYNIFVYDNSSLYGTNWNFGNPAFTILSGNSDGNGYGNFEYAVPSGYYALNTKNLAEYG